VAFVLRAPREAGGARVLAPVAVHLGLLWAGAVAPVLNRRRKSKPAVRRRSRSGWHHATILRAERGGLNTIRTDGKRR
jgi:hypothetical protein